MKLARASAGFSLLEVTVAVLILGFAFAGFTQAMNTSLLSNKDSELLAAASHLAASQVELLRAEPFFSNGTTEGLGTGRLSHYKWRQTVSGTPLAGLHDVAIVVEHATQGQPLFELRTYLFQQPSDSTDPGANRKEAESKEKRRRR